MIPLEVINLSKTLSTAAGAVPALRSFTAQFVSGGRTAIVGPSGCGKSTLLYLLGLLDAPTSGEIKLMGQPVAALPPEELAALRNRHLGFVFQFHYLLPELTVMENLLAPALRAGTLLAEATCRAQALLVEIGLAAKADRLANQLSGGEQQRVAVVRALMNKPAIVLADEPTGNLDHTNSEKVFELLTRACQQEGATLIMVTHNAELAGRCDTTIRLLDGQRA